jgi:hypothetical protein
MSKTTAKTTAKPDAEATIVEAETETALEPFQKPVPTITAADPTPNGTVKVRVLPKGHGRVATGHFDQAANAFTYHSKGDHLFLGAALAKTQEDAGLVEIVSGD